MAGPRLPRSSLAPYKVLPVYRLLQDTARRLPGKVALVDGERRFTFRQLDHYSDRFAAALASLGVRKGDRVGVLAPNCAEFEIAFFGIAKAGAVATTVNAGYREREVAHQLESSGAETLVVDHTLLGVAQPARGEVPGLRRLVVIEAGPGASGSFWDLIERAGASPPEVTVNPKGDLAALPYSSGTTGLSKGVMLTHCNLTINVTQFLDRPGEAAAPSEQDVFLVHLPLFHIYAMNVLMNPSIACGATQVLMGRFDVELLLRLIAQHRVTCLYTVPPVVLALGQYPRIGDFDLSALRLVVSGAAPLSMELQRKVAEHLGVPVLQAYGLTEASPVTNIDFVEADRIRPGTVGPPVADTEERVVRLDSAQREALPGEAGELWVRGPQVMQGYFNDPDATAQAVDADGWLHTGDIVTMDRDGHVQIRDRKKELIKYKGFQVPPAELEGLLLEHPEVADAAVIGRPDPEAGEVPKAFIVRKPGSGVTGEDLMAFVAQRVATFKHVRSVEFVDTIPKTASGKILRRLLLERERG